MPGDEGGEVDTDGPQPLSGRIRPLTEIERQRLFDPLENARAALRAARVAGHEDWSWPSNGERG